LFTLQEQPSKRQRKANKSECRYLSPNPLVVRAREAQSGMATPRVSGGFVHISLVTSKDNQDVASSVFDTADGNKVVSLDTNLIARFSIRVLSCTEGNSFKVRFTVQYVVADEKFEESFFSHAFTMYAIRKRNHTDLPVIQDIKPKHGHPGFETEVWIKGRGFTEHVIVTFGGAAATVIEVFDSVVTVISPLRPDLQQDTLVPVMVTTKFQNELQDSDSRISFLYKANP